MTLQAYQVLLYCGDGPLPQVAEGTRLMNVTPSDNTPEAIAEAIARSGVSANDLRAKAAVIMNGDIHRALAVFIALAGFAGRRLDVVVGEDIMDGSALDAAVRSVRDSGKPASVPEQLQVGPVVHPELRSVLTDHAPTADESALIRHAKRVRLVAASDLLQALMHLVVVSGLRARRDHERLPIVVGGDEPVVVEEGEVLGLDLDAIYRSGAELRRSVRPEDGIPLVEALPISDRRSRLIEAAGLDVEEVMVRLGSKLSPRTGFWHCPRPERHAHGDRDASTKVEEGTVRCYRCDPERIDVLRLTCDCLGLSVDEGAEWLLSDARREPHVYPGYEDETEIESASVGADAV